MFFRDFFKSENTDSKWKNWAIGISIAVSILLTLGDYVIQNCSYPLFDNSTILAWVDRVCPPQKKFFDENDVTYVNFSKDKVLVPVTEFGDTVGNEVITDRATLLRFLKLADSSDYRYIFLDIRFEEGYETPYDSELFHRIVTMPRLIIANHRSLGDYEIADSQLLKKAAYADYRGTLFSGFTRYEFLQDRQPSVALRMFKDIDGHDIKKCWYGYTTEKGGLHLCYNLKYIPLPDILHKSIQTEITDDTYGEEVRYPYAGSTILNQNRIPEDEVIHNLLDNKIIILGDFDNDLHGTYIGEVPGPVISFAAYKYLQAGLHKVSFLYVAFLLILYFLISLTILTNRHISNFFNEKTYWFFILSLFGLGALFFIIMVLLYRLFLISMVWFLPTIFFHIMGNASDFRTFKLKRNAKSTL